MKFVFTKATILFFLISCTNINFLLDEGSSSNFLKNKTKVYLSGWSSPALKEAFFLNFGEASETKFLLVAEVNQKKTKRSVDKNQVATKIDYKIIINYKLSDLDKKCADILNSQESGFSFAPKSSGYNFASDILFENLLGEAAMNNLNDFIDFANKALHSQNCLNEN